MSTNLLLRRAHLYLGMLLIPWLMIYALSTEILNHGDHFKKFRAADPQFTPLWSKDYTLPIAVQPDNLRDVAQRILADNDLSGAFGVQRQGNRLNINVQNFLEPKRLSYDLEAKRLTAEKKKFAWPEVFTRLHFRAGYNGTGLLPNLWPVLVDVFCVSMLMWIATGLYLWWKIRDSRNWGWAAIGSGALTIVMLLATL